MHGKQKNGKSGHEENNMNKKIIVAGLISIILVFMIIALYSLFIRGNQAVESSDAKMVREIPEGFVLLPKEGGGWENGLRYVPWESQISFLDANDNCIYQTDFSNSDFIVKYQNEYYVNEEKLSELIEKANVILE